ncbi:MAG: hypothetical protein ACRC28_05305 [Clostridium sp.]|uniref:hypothetical protein n=1 Tax=Clostridium sp. TaxID=1506 RepID=UPI003F389230
MSKIKVLLGGLIIVAASSTVAFAAKSATVNGWSGKDAWSGYCEGGKNSYNVYAAARTDRIKGQGDRTLRSYVEIVNKQGYKIGPGADKAGYDKVLTATIVREGGHAIQASHGLVNETASRTYTNLFHN